MGTVAVVGAAGIIGPAIVATLAEHESVERILVLDMNESGAREVADRFGGGRASAGALDIRDRDRAVAALDGQRDLHGVEVHPVGRAVQEDVGAVERGDRPVTVADVERAGGSPAAAEAVGHLPRP